MNKLRLIKIYELKGRIHPIEKNIIDLMSNLNIVYKDGYDVYQNGNIPYMEYYHFDNNLYIHTHFETIFYRDFKCYPDEMYEIFSYIFKKRLNITIQKVY